MKREYTSDTIARLSACPVNRTLTVFSREIVYVAEPLGERPDAGEDATVRMHVDWRGPVFGVRAHSNNDHLASAVKLK
jgi:hypothetical protein